MMCEHKFDKFRHLKFLEKHRIESFKDWPFDEKTNCSILKMAEAGFYWSGNEREADTATCFVCCKTLDGWEATDCPWKEHAKHAPQCAFVQLGRKQDDLAVEELINIFGVVLKNIKLKNLEDKKNELRKIANRELDKFMSKK